jgi:hypothetical protein
MTRYLAAQTGAAMTPTPEQLQDKVYSGKFLLRLPKALHEKADKRSDAEGVSLNYWCGTVIAEAVGAPLEIPDESLHSSDFDWKKMEEIAADELCSEHDVRDACYACLAIRGTRWALQMKQALNEAIQRAEAAEKALASSALHGLKMALEAVEAISCDPEDGGAYVEAIRDAERAIQTLINQQAAPKETK